MADDVYYCSNCGGIMIFDVKTQMLKCPNCDTTVKIVNEKDSIVEHPFSAKIAKTINVREKTSSTMQCKGCGAKVEISVDCTATQCPYCGANYVLAQKQEDAIIPDGVVPFKIDKPKVRETFHKWINRRWLAPNSLKHLYESDKIQGIYVPYWTFDADIVCDYSAEGGENREVEEEDSEGNTVTRTVTDWYHTHGCVKKFFDDVEVKASKNMKSSLLEGIEPYDTISQLASYSPQYISGYGAECYTVPLEEAHKTANEKMEDELKDMVRDDVLRRYDEVRNIRIAPDYRDETYKHILIPVYATSFHYKNKNYAVLINGQTGKIKGDYPKSPVKIIAIILIIAALLAALFAWQSSNDKKNRNSNGTGMNEPAVETEYCLNQYDELIEFDVQDDVFISEPISNLEDELINL